ncbi:hypothetical protein C8Q79DRAFT_920788 [Trametes meyenii]|nr:hypothetical protein C8Q79DRAFT_920788 [Trametes meyenii]
MPHKRAKRSVREKNRNESGNDLVPGVRKSIENEEIPKSVARVLNAAKVQREWAEKKRKAQADDGPGPSRKKRRRDGAEEVDGNGGSSKSQLRIQPGESMAHFNRRVEDSMRHSVREAMQNSSAKMRKNRKEELSQNPTKAPSDPQLKSRVRNGDASGSDEDEDDDAPSRPAKRKDEKPREFEKLSSSAPKRLNDIVQAPPQLKKLPRKAKKLAAQGQGSAQKSEGAKSLRDGLLSMAQKAMMEEERERVIRMYREMKRGKPQT